MLIQLFGNPRCMLQWRIRNVRTPYAALAEHLNIHTTIDPKP